jgi:predicted nucleic acid-binding protein
LTGALGVLGSAYRRSLIEDPIRILAEMRKQGFRISDDMEARFRILLGTRYRRVM